MTCILKILPLVKDTEEANHWHYLWFSSYQPQNIQGDRSHLLLVQDTLNITGYVILNMGQILYSASWSINDYVAIACVSDRHCNRHEQALYIRHDK